ncbi:hypothetical protein BDV36DRAFT_292364 [Aspergillus pseudocaelatus]|uniref:Uncharacterized protein n=1 Tax=Aspergillus pseudocaelatus TaxID=1825620 RepID=A0ABQ6WWF4_9EURO|nr:hypothetical protein BDV36DRAFT_292364 [Aspergillus pseudocaelatus]
MKFLSGLPSKDFHYALLWSCEYDRPREGFPSWSWAGWHSLQQVIDTYPKKGDSGYMTELEDGSYEHRGPQVTELELEGFYISPIEHPHMFNRCSQELAQVRVAASTDCLTSESVHFLIDIVADRTKSHEDDRVGNSYASHIPRWDSTDTVNLPHTIRGSTLTWLLRDDIVLIKIVGVKLLEGADGLQK